MSPASALNLRRYRAERLLRGEFEGLRSKVLSIVSGRLRAAGVRLDHADLEACYAQAWQGLYTAILEGEEVENPAGWLVLVTFRRAIDEHRSRGREQVASGGDGAGGQARLLEQDFVDERDVTGELDDRARVRQLLEGMRSRLSERECQAAALCYLQGLSRAQAAAQMGISDARMRKLMEGKGAGRPGVAGKLGALVETIREGAWCDEQASLMRALAFGILDPEGERYRLAVAHRRECPACRRYVLSLRGLAAVLPPIVLPWRSGRAAKIGRVHAARTGSSVGARSLAGKLVVGSALVVGLGTGSVVLIARSDQHRASVSPVGTVRLGQAAGFPAPASPLGGASFSNAHARAYARAMHVFSQGLPTARSYTSASREFGPERSPRRSVRRLRAPASPPTEASDARGAGSGDAAGPPPIQAPGTRAQHEFGLE